ncbi:MAG: DUF2764 family protein [Halieaceae bacterium]|jgi:hypothetical protein|nr:DUF2764 family protein [Halieaceae bacterium]
MGREYIELICSLPFLANPFVHRRPPISNVQLTKRLNMLDYEDRQLVRELAQTFYWGSISGDRSDEQIAYRARRLIARVQQEDLSEWLQWRMDMRTVIAALRRRKRGEDAPPVGDWGYGRYTLHLERNWSHPTFRLAHTFPWLPEAKSLLEERETFELERVLLSAAWDYYSTREPVEPFGVAAVWLYLMRWDLVERWCSYDSDNAKLRFDELVASALEAPLAELRKIA